MSIEYHEKPELPGKKFFQCPSGMGVINIKFCSEAHEKANTKEYITETKRQACRFCPTGMLHAGKRDTASGSRLFSSMICSRCERWSNRSINQRLCPSCYNRQAECAKGLNAKNNPLKKIRKYRDIPILVIKSAQIELSVKNQVMSLSEAVLSTLINTSENCSFAWVGGNILPAVQQSQVVDFHQS